MLPVQNRHWISLSIGLCICEKLDNFVYLLTQAAETAKS